MRPHTPAEIISRIAAAVQPLVFETGVVDAPYATAGTVFLAGHKGKSFVITARHSLNPENIYPICVFPSDTSQRLVPLKNVFFIRRDHVDDDFADFAVIEIDTAEIASTEVGAGRLIDLALVSGDWLSHSDSAELIVFGYPRDHSSVDYDNEEIRHQRFVLRGRYIGPSSSAHVH